MTSTRALLAGGVLAGPLYVLVDAVQAATRDGFDLRRHAASQLSNGDLGWVQISLFVLTGLLTIGAATGLHRVYSGWGPRLVAGYGIGLVLAGAFVADPSDGFPVGTPAGPPDRISWHGTLHFVVAGLAFVSLIAACFVFARRFSGPWSIYSTATAVLFAVSWIALVALPGRPAAAIAFALGVVLAWAWVTAVSARPLAGAGQPAAQAAI